MSNSAVHSEKVSQVLPPLVIDLLGNDLLQLILVQPPIERLQLLMAAAFQPCPEHPLPPRTLKTANRSLIFFFIATLSHLSSVKEKPKLTKLINKTKTNQTKRNSIKYSKGFEMSKSAPQLLHGPELVPPRYFPFY